MIVLDRDSREPLYMQIYLQLRQGFLDGTFKEGQILAGSRGLAGTLQVSRNTVDNAYSQLMAEGYIVPRKGIGYAVAGLPELDMGRDRPARSSSLHSGADAAKAPDDRPILYDLTNSSHTSDLFPRSLWRRYTLECLERLGQEARLSAGQDRQGELYLRRSLLSYLERIRGVHCTQDQIIITSGIQQSLDCICKLLSPGNGVFLMEEPGFNKAAAVFKTNRIAIRTVPVDENGIVISALPQDGLADALYSTPSHQFPTGVTMPVSRRYELLHWAAKSGAYIIEDDFDSEMRYYAKPIPSLQSIDAQDRVIYLGTFSKALSPSIRMGYMILPPRLLKLYDETFSDYNSTVPLLNQYVVARLIETGQYDRHIRRLNHIFRKRLELFTAGFSDVKHRVKISSNRTGQYFLMEFSDSADQTELIAQALEKGVRVYPTMQFWQDKAECPPNTLFLGFGKIPLEDIPDCVSRLKSAWACWL